MAESWSAPCPFLGRFKLAWDGASIVMVLLLVGNASAWDLSSGRATLTLNIFD